MNRPPPRLFELTLVRISTSEVLTSLSDYTLQECDFAGDGAVIYLQRNSDATAGLEVELRGAADLNGFRVYVVFSPRDELFPAETECEKGDFRVWCRAGR